MSARPPSKVVVAPIRTGPFEQGDQLSCRNCMHHSSIYRTLLTLLLAIESSYTEHKSHNARSPDSSPIEKDQIKKSQHPPYAICSLAAFPLNARRSAAGD